LEYTLQVFNCYVCPPTRGVFSCVLWEFIHFFVPDTQQRAFTSIIISYQN